jgi:hypothetical protein
VCFDAARYRCNATDPAPVRCVATAGCDVGFVCVREFCACDGTTTGICVGTDGCGRGGADAGGEMVGFGEFGKSMGLL